MIVYTAVLLIRCWSVIDRDRGNIGSCSRVDFKNYTLSELYALAPNSSSQFTDSDYYRAAWNADAV